MSNIYLQRQEVANSLSPEIINVLKEFANKKWAGGCLSGSSAKFMIYYRTYADEMSLLSQDGYFEWTVVPAKGTPIQKGSTDFKYPAYSVMLEFEPDSTTPDHYYVSGHTTATVTTEDASEAALREALLEVLTKNYPPGESSTFDFEDSETHLVYRS